jgi:hypothetical protein
VLRLHAITQAALALGMYTYCSATTVYSIYSMFKLMLRTTHVDTVRGAIVTVYF